VRGNTFYTKLCSRPTFVMHFGTPLARLAWLYGTIWRDRNGCPPPWVLLKPALALHYITLHCTTLHCTTLRYTALHYTILHYTALHYTTLHFIALHYTTVHYSTLHCTTPHHTTLHQTTLHYTDIVDTPLNILSYSSAYISISIYIYICI